MYYRISQSLQTEPCEWQNSTTLSIKHYAISLTNEMKHENLLSLSTCLKKHSVLGTINLSKTNDFFL